MNVVKLVTNLTQKHLIFRFLNINCWTRKFRIIQQVEIWWVLTYEIAIYRLSHPFLHHFLSHQKGNQSNWVYIWLDFKNILKIDFFFQNRSNSNLELLNINIRWIELFWLSFDHSKFNYTIHKIHFKIFKSSSIK